MLFAFHFSFSFFFSSPPPTAAPSSPICFSTIRGAAVSLVDPLSGFFPSAFLPLLSNGATPDCATGSLDLEEATIGTSVLVAGGLISLSETTISTVGVSVLVTGCLISLLETTVSSLPDTFFSSPTVILWIFRP
ncbi:hypothetical protein HanOQP8_Chr00c006g0684511 [Helianthus annuus]|nr:hypothetical protein HanOQP8_Chr00c006g0684511 [Helianthus annuus]